MKIKVLLACLLSVLGLLFPSSLLAGGAKTVWVSAYTKKDGTYVSGHFRSPPDGTGAGHSPEVGSLMGYYPTGVSASSTPRVDYRYKIQVYEDGRRLCEKYAGLYDTHGEAAESTTWQVQECLREEFYSRKMTHLEVNTLLAEVFSKANCTLRSSPPLPSIDIMGGRYTVFESTMTCSAPARRSQSPISASPAPAPAPGRSASTQKKTPPAKALTSAAAKTSLPLTCRAVDDGPHNTTTLCRTGSDVVKLRHRGETFFTFAEASGELITISSAGSAGLVASALDGTSAMVSIDQK